MESLILFILNASIFALLVVLTIGCVGWAGSRLDVKNDGTLGMMLQDMLAFGFLAFFAISLLLPLFACIRIAWNYHTFL